MDLSHAEIRSLLASAVPQGEWVEDVYPAYVISQSADGGLVRRDYQINPDRTVSLGEAVTVRREVSYERVFSFSIQPQAYAAVARSGKLFEAQFFAERGLGVTEEELDEVIAGFAGAPILIQHERTIFDDLPADSRPGWVTRIWRKGRELFGEVRLAQWLSDLFADQPIKVSVGLSSVRPRRLVELSLVPNPRISDAAIFAAAQQFAQAGKGAGAAPHQASNTPMSTPLTNEDRTFLDGLRRLFGFGASAPAPDPTEARFAALEAQVARLAQSAPAAPPAPVQPPAAPTDFAAAAQVAADTLIQAGALPPARRDEFAAGYAAVAPAGQPALNAYVAAFGGASPMTRSAVPAQSQFGGAESIFEADGTLKLTTGGKN